MKKILVTFNQAPFGSMFYAEGLRACLGLAGGAEQHIVKIVYLGDGVYYALNGADRENTSKYIRDLGEIGCKFMVEQESLDGRGISEKEIGSEFEVVSRKSIISLLEECDVTIDF